MATLSDIFDFNPGDFCEIKFPENFILEYKSDFLCKENTATFVCTRMKVYRYDEEDRDDINFYFYGQNNSSNWVTKSYYLTEESYSKVCDYLVEKLSSEGKIKVENGYVVQPYQ